MTINPEFKVGMELYTRDGRRVELLAVTKEDTYVVSQVLRIEGYDGDYEYHRGETTFETELFKAAPVAIVDEKLVAAEKRLREVERECSTRVSAAVNAEREVKDRLAKLAKYKGLERLEDFIEGKYTHFVIERYSQFEIKGKDAALDQGDTYDKRIRLLSLHGDTEGNLTWNLNRWRDGSGNWEYVIPCVSEDEAREKVAELCAADIAGWRDGSKNDNALTKAVSSLRNASLPVPDDIAVALKKIEVKAAEANVAKIRQALEAAEALLAEKAGAA